MQTMKVIQNKLIKAAVLVAAVFAIGTTGHARNNRFNESSVAVNPTAVNFGRMNVGSTSKPVPVSIKNTGHSSVTISGVSLSLLQVTYSGPALPVTIAPGGSVNATVSFSPNAAQAYTGTLNFTQNSGHTFSARLSGSGVPATKTTTPPTPPTPPTTPPTPAPATLNLGASALSFGSLTSRHPAPPRR